MKPKGHKRGCKCVVCDRPMRKNTRRKPAKRNAGYERQADVALWNRPDRAGRKTNVRHNSTVIIPGTTRSRSAASGLAAHRARRKNPLPFEIVVQLRDASTKNPVDHFPRTTRGPKGNIKWYILDLYDGRGNLVSSRYRKCARAKCATEAAGLVNRRVGKKMVRKVELSGPYGRKPNAKTTRK